MELDWIWKAVIIVLGGTLILKIAGRKSISQLTLAQTVIMVGIGPLLMRPIGNQSIWVTLGIGSTLILTLILLEYAQMKFDAIEKLITGKSIVLVEDGVLNEKHLKKLRFTVDQLEMKLRQQNVARLSDLKWATLEPNGQIGYELKPEAQPVTMKDFELLKKDLEQILQTLNPGVVEQTQQPESEDDLFSEVSRKSKNEPPEHLQ
ncbi:DUF421 domain-containing protein [Pseudalkalibacillus sp. Hm43]|uniref:DUF421 domain-containing protein n=1 Tax=Pseudalkalibacillus sp. Hm43 TaxID=3450742 RepID=UPI003F438EAF